MEGDLQDKESPRVVHAAKSTFSWLIGTRKVPTTGIVGIYDVMLVEQIPTVPLFDRLLLQLSDLA